MYINICLVDSTNKRQQTAIPSLIFREPLVKRAKNYRHYQSYSYFAQHDYRCEVI